MIALASAISRSRLLSMVLFFDGLTVTAVTGIYTHKYGLHYPEKLIEYASRGQNFAAISAALQQEDAPPLRITTARYLAMQLKICLLTKKA